MSGNLFFRSTSSIEYYCGTYKSIRFGLESLLKTQILKKKATLPVKTKLSTSFNSYYHLWQTSRNNSQGSANYSYPYCMNYRVFLGPKMLLKTQFFEKKKQSFHWKKNWRLLSRFIERHKAQETIYKGPKAIFTNALKFIRAFLRNWEVDENISFFRKKGKLSIEQNYLTNLFRIMEHDKTQATNWNGP